MTLHAPPSAVGLTNAEAERRVASEGANRLPRPRRRSAARRLADQLVHFFAVMLWVAGALAFVAQLPQLGIAIFAVILINAAFAFVQENKADRAAERLRDLLPMAVTVIRDGRPQAIDAADVVVDDLVVLAAGDRVPADAEPTSATSLLIDTSMLTGESVPTPVDVGGTLHAGTFVVEGEATAVVRATGEHTRLAAIARLTTATPDPASPLTVELRRVVRLIAAIAVVVGGVFFATSLLLGNGASDGFVFAIGVTVALVPEALLPTVTLSLAWGAEQMAKRQVLVRDLPAVETLGSTTFICTDKTGTLTCNQMTVVEAWTPGGSLIVDGAGYTPEATVVLSAPEAEMPVRTLALAAARCSSGYAYEKDGEWRAHGDPMEAALDVLGRRLGIDTDGDRADHRATARHPFDPRRRRMSLVVDGLLLVKGAPDSVLPRCEGETTAQAQPVLDALTAKGLRVLAVAGRRFEPAVDTGPPDEIETELELYGLLGLEDPPRDDVAAAIAACRRAGVRIAVVTGDHPATAVAIATEVGLRGADDLVLVGAELPTDEQVLGAMLDHDGIVIARVSPEDKLRIARALRARGHVVAMTGDGVNDGPALHEADIGIAMGRSGTDVAREAADLVLLDDSFASIVAGIEQGRATFLNVRRFLTYHLTDNVAELTPFVLWALSGGRFPLALGVLQILAIDIGTDTLSAVALGAEPPAAHALDKPPVRGRLLNRTVLWRAFGLLGPTLAACSMAAFLASFVAAGWRPGESFPEGAALAAASGAAFMAVVLGQKANVFACRSSTRWPGALGWTTNRLLLPAGALELAFSLFILLVGPVAAQFDHAPPPLAGWAVALASIGVVLAVDAAYKRWRSRSGAVAAGPPGDAVR
jgi:calcium-translocating P-type ATPase